MASRGQSFCSFLLIVNLLSVGKLINEGLHRIGVAFVVNSSLKKTDYSVGVVLRCVLADVSGVKMKSPRNVNAAAVIIAGFLPVGAGGGVELVVEGCPFGGVLGKVKAGGQIVIIGHGAFPFRLAGDIVLCCLHYRLLLACCK
uniref:Uncharacterized protein n=1 Tax=Ackermannviridae sp. TaxID=2831612 RepID=A0A8S5RQN6_9CAUD|nr:MAG TPA: hypothetical protein [Ackermannviridae sp.]